MNCIICTKTNHHPDGVIAVVATFPQHYFAKNVLEDVEKAHITPVGTTIISGEQKTLIVQLHGIKDIIQLEGLYIESMCRNNNALTIDLLTTKNQCDKLMQQFA
ncbi:MAG TPA: hypothetical protein VEW42_05390 [Candidatus Eisenbacteria bacterium]|nr:hypothetical protein [Candidatus Eisenbacteria bacterium]